MKATDATTIIEMQIRLINFIHPFQKIKGEFKSPLI